MKVLSFIAPLVLAYLAQKRATSGGIKDAVKNTTDDNGNLLTDIVGSVLGNSSKNGGLLSSIFGALFGKK